MAPWLVGWRERARRLKTEVYALYLAYQDPRVPWHARAFAACVVAYGFSPIDLIPDFIPVLGYLDDLLFVPLGIWLALKMIPPQVMAECREKAQEVMRQGKPVNRAAAMVIVAVWLLLAGLAVVWLLRIARR
ncbi:MAG TPA: YkvA family protein [Anaerolineae bacterium]|nr:YkvA family protein [Anaerolineae bacterium]